MKWVPGFILSFNRFRLTWSLLCPHEKKKGSQLHLSSWLRNLHWNAPQTPFGLIIFTAWASPPERRRQEQNKLIQSTLDWLGYVLRLLLTRLDHHLSAAWQIGSLVKTPHGKWQIKDERQRNFLKLSLWFHLPSTIWTRRAPEMRNGFVNVAILIVVIVA